jgi:hypothetical protein
MLNIIIVSCEEAQDRRIPAWASVCCGSSEPVVSKTWDESSGLYLVSSACLNEFGEEVIESISVNLDRLGQEVSRNPVGLNLCQDIVEPDNWEVMRRDCWRKEDSVCFLLRVSLIIMAPYPDDSLSLTSLDVFDDFHIYKVEPREVSVFGLDNQTSLRTAQGDVMREVMSPDLVTQVSNTDFGVVL